MKKTYTGSCQCGAVRFEADIDLSGGTYRCNCSICARTRFWPAVIKPASFRLLSGETELTEYRFNAKKNRHLFCKHCDVRSFGIGEILESGDQVYGVGVTCLENVKPHELINAPITYVDGRNNNWHLPPTEIRHL